MQLIPLVLSNVVPHFLRDHRRVFLACSRGFLHRPWRLSFLLSALWNTLPLMLAPPVQAIPNEASFSSSHGDFFALLNPEKTDFSLGFRAEPKREEDGGPGELELRLYGVRGEVPLPLSENAFWRVGGNVELKNYDFHPVPDARSNTSSENLYKILGEWGIGYFASDNLLVSALWGLGIYSDLDGGLDEQDFRLTGQAVLVYRVNPEAEVLLGARRSKDYEDISLLPFGGVRLLGEDGRLHISLTVPLEVRVGYRTADYLELYAGGWASGDEYRAKVGDVNTDVLILDRRIGIGAVFTIVRRFTVTVEAGAQVDSKFELEADESGQFDHNLKPGPYLALQLGLAL